jgi:hypothetical protein
VQRVENVRCDADILEADVRQADRSDVIHDGEAVLDGLIRAGEHEHEVHAP